MLLDTEIDIIVAPQKLKFYQDLGYPVINKNQKIKIRIEHLSLQSHLLVNVECDVCHIQKKLRYDKYNKNIKNINVYCCSEKCAINKIKLVTFQNHGIANFNNRKKFIETFTEKYGVENPGQLDAVRTKMKNTTLERYGVEHNMQSKELFDKNQLSGHRTKNHETMRITYRGTYEKDFLDFCYSNNITLDNTNSINFIFKGKKKVYHPDFYIDSKKLIIEIKSDYYFEKYKELNLAKEKACIEQGYKFIFIINKDYKNFSTWI
jgi:hypothetical protein